MIAYLNQITGIVDGWSEANEIRFSTRYMNLAKVVIKRAKVLYNARTIV